MHCSVLHRPRPPYDRPLSSRRAHDVTNVRTTWPPCLFRLPCPVPTTLITPALYTFQAGAAAVPE